MIELISPMWEELASAFSVEPKKKTSGGIGGPAPPWWPTAEATCWPGPFRCCMSLRAQDPRSCTCAWGHDIARFDAGGASNHLETCGRPGPATSCFVGAEKYAGYGSRTNRRVLAKHFHDQYQLRFTHADPRAREGWHREGDEVLLRRRPDRPGLTAITPSPTSRTGGQGRRCPPIANRC